MRSTNRYGDVPKPSSVRMAVRKRRIFLPVAAMLAGMIWGLGCGDGSTEPPPPDPPRPTTVTVMPATAQLAALGATLQLTAQVYDQDGQLMAGATVTWASGAPAVATVSSTGLVTAADNGTATVTASAGSASGAAEITVVQEVSSLIVSPDTAALQAIGDTLRLMAEATDANGHAVTNASVVWGSDDEAVAAVDSSGLVRAMGEGTATVTASAGSASGAAEITVAPQADRIVLTTFYRETGGPDWTNSRNWLSSEPLARWHGIEVDAEGRVIGLALSDNNVVGPIPAQAGDLSGLQYLHLGDNGLTGKLPSELARAERLTSLKINGNALSGPIPLSLSALSLRELHYNDTELCVPDDDSFREWLRGIPSHEGTGVECVPPTDREILLALYDATDGPNWKDNTGWLTEAPLREWHGVRADRDGRVVDLSLFGNGLWGTLPPEIGGLSRLASLDLRANSLTGPIPTELGNLAELEYLRLGANALTGTIPSELGDLSALVTLTLNTNHLTGRIPGELGNLVRLRSLVLDRNRLSGPLPPELGSLASLEILELSYNLLDGAVPAQLLQLGELTTLFLHVNGGLCLPGTARFVTWWSQIRQPRGNFCNTADASVLESFHHATSGPGWTNSDGWLGGQPLSAWHGVETDSLGRVRQLGLTDNGLEGTLGPELSELAALTELRIADNALLGPVPLEFTQLELREFDYSGTELCTPADPYFREWLNSIADHQGTGVECAPLSDRTVLEVLYEATDGDDWETNSGWMTNRPLGDWHGVDVDEEGRVTSLSLVSNNLAGRIPAELGHLTELGSLRLQDNALTGRTPAALGRLAKLVDLSLSFNDLRGGIPRELGNLTALTWLDLASNRGLGGSIPPELGRLANLTELRLNDAGLTGRIPSELGNLSRLGALILYGNSLTGGIPPEFGNLSSLRVLALFDNVLTGPIPSELGRLAALEHFGAYWNALSGAIPPSLGGMASLKGLWLHSNRLSGRIPPEIGRLKRLTGLVLGQNELTGTIPREIGNLSALEVLHLERNTLTGGIPAELGGLTALQDFDLSHNSAMRGTLPATVAALTRLDRMLLGGTQLCMPRTSALLEWLRGIEKRRVALCGGEEGSIAYLTQAVQSHEFPVPLVAAESALLRVFVKAGSAAGVSMPLVRARFYLDGTEVHVADIPGGPAAVPTEIVEGDLSMSANAEIPDSVIQPGLEMVVEIDPDSTLDPNLGITARIPPTGRSEVGVRAVPPFDLTVIPFLLASDPDSSLLDTTRGLNPESELLWDLNSLLPIADLEVDVHEPVSASSVHPYTVLDMTEAIRIMEGGDGYYLGLVPMSEPSAIRGVAILGGRSQASRPIPSVIAHEAGHNLNLTHAPCGGAGGPDPSFPHRNGSIGAWGFDPRTNELVPPGTGALMSYCSPRWVSDYNFTNMVSYRVAAEEDGSASMASPARSILLWGGVDAGLGPFLEPSLVIDAPAVLPRSGGPHRVTGTDADERELFSLNFDMPVVSDSDGRASFAFALPAPPEWAGVLANITLSGPAGSVTLNRESSRPMAILLDAQSGRVRRILRDEAGTVSSYADAEEAFSAGRRFKVLFSRGIPDATAWER